MGGLLSSFQSGQSFTPILDELGTVFKASAASFDFNSISGLVLWLDASKGITKDESDLVELWEDQSPDGNNYVQATEAAKPLFVDSVVNGLPILRFDGTNDFIGMSAQYSGGAISPPFYCFVVCKYDQPAGDKNALTGNNGSTNTQTMHWSSSPEDFNIYGGESLSLYPAGDPWGTDFHVCTMKFQNTSAGAIRLDGVELKTGTTGALTQDRSLFGKHLTAGQFYDGDAAFILIYDNDIGDDNRDIVEEQLMSMFNL